MSCYGTKLLLQVGNFCYRNSSNRLDKCIPRDGHENTEELVGSVLSMSFIFSEFINSQQTWERLMLQAVRKTFVAIQLADTHFSCVRLGSSVRAGESCSFWLLPSPRVGMPEVGEPAGHTSDSRQGLAPLSLHARACPPARWVSCGKSCRPSTSAALG